MPCKLLFCLLQRESSEAQHNVQVWAAANSLAEARPQLRKVRSGVGTSPDFEESHAFIGHWISLYRRIQLPTLRIIILSQLLLQPSCSTSARRKSQSRGSRFSSSQSCLYLQAFFCSNVYVDGKHGFKRHDLPID